MVAWGVARPVHPGKLVRCRGWAGDDRLIRRNAYGGRRMEDGCERVVTDLEREWTDERGHRWAMEISQK